MLAVKACRLLSVRSHSGQVLKREALAGVPVAVALGSGVASKLCSEKRMVKPEQAHGHLLE